MVPPRPDRPIYAGCSPPGVDNRPETVYSIRNYDFHAVCAVYEGDEVKKEIEDIIGIPAEDAPCISAKTGLNVDEVLERIVSDLPAPIGDENAPLKCLIFDSIYNDYKGAIAYVRVKDGTVKVGDEIMLMANKKFIHQVIN